LASLTAAIEAARERARAEVAEAVASVRFRDLLIEVTGWVDTGEWLSHAPSGEPARPFAARALQSRRRKLMKDGRGLSKLSDHDRHQVRIDAKKLRYAAEGFQALFGRKAAGRFIKPLKALQDELGALNDVATAEALIVSLRLSPEAAFAAGELIGRKSADRDRHIARGAKALDALADVDPFWR
jgi:CHAD domain-containing protein